MLEILEILTIPKTVATVHRPADLDFLRENDASASCDLLEFRLDSLREHLDRTEEAIAAADLPCIITARHPDEGGDGDLDSSQRLALYERFLPYAALIDVELRSLEESVSLIVASRKKGVAVIASYHDFEKTPPLSELRSVLEVVMSGGADIGKFAAFIDSMTALFECTVFFETWKKLSREQLPDPKVSLMGMGPLGKLSRLVFASAGSCLNYGYLVEPNAPGQWPAAELKRLIAELQPNSN